MNPIDEHELQLVADYCRERRSAVLVLLFTDLQGSAVVGDQRGDPYYIKWRSTHESILTRVMVNYTNGRIIKWIGDSLLAVFSEPSSAVQAALRMQRELRAWNRRHPNDAPMLLRIGLHMGQVTVEERGVSRDVFGGHVNKAARVEALAGGGQIYLTHAVFDSAHQFLKGKRGLAWDHLGEHHLRGIEEAERLYAVRAEPTSTTSKADAAEEAAEIVRIYTVGAHNRFGFLSWTQDYRKAQAKWDEFWRANQASVTASPLAAQDYGYLYQRVRPQRGAPAQPATAKASRALAPSLLRRLESRRNVWDQGQPSGLLEQLSGVDTTTFDDFDAQGVAYKDIRRAHLGHYCPPLQVV